VERRKFIQASFALGLISMMDTETLDMLRASYERNNKFTWGCATASYQIEGAYNEDGKGPSIWDTFTHKKGKIKHGETGDVACDFYHRFRGDIDILAELKIPAFRFSLSWPRIFPEGRGAANSKGVDFYQRVIDHCLESGVEPWVTLYHWDLPQALEDKGGWKNREMVGWFGEYADYCTRVFGGRVKNWIVLNEPLSFTGAGYFLGLHAPGKIGAGNFLPAAHHAALCNAEGGRIARANVPNGNIGTSFSCSHIEARSQRARDIQAAGRYDALFNRMFIEPLTGMGYPYKSLPVLERIFKYFKAEDEQDLVFDYDFIGIQNYTREIIRHSMTTPYLRGRIIPAHKRTDDHTAKDWEVYPKGIYHLLKRFAQYPRVKSLIVTENGAAFDDIPDNGRVEDTLRINYLKEYTSEVLKAREEGVPVNGYFVWSMLDNFEWADGYTPRFGLVYVDYANQQRIIKESAYWYSRFIASQP
jgi:beta-glucosidase